MATQAGRQLSDVEEQCGVARNRKDDEKGKLKSDSEARELRDEVEPDRPSNDIGVNRVRVRPPRHAQFPTRTAAPSTDLPGSECAYARRLRAGEDTDVNRVSFPAGAVERSSELSVQPFQVHEVGSGAAEPQLHYQLS